VPKPPEAVHSRDRDRPHLTQKSSRRGGDCYLDSLSSEKVRRSPPGAWPRDSKSIPTDGLAKEEKEKRRISCFPARGEIVRRTEEKKSIFSSSWPELRRSREKCARYLFREAVLHAGPGVTSLLPIRPWQVGLGIPFVPCAVMSSTAEASNRPSCFLMPKHQICSRD
jgi:hypothetical protein